MYWRNCQNIQSNIILKISVLFITQLLRTDLQFVDIPSELIIHKILYLDKIKQKLERVDYRQTQKYLDDKLENTRQTDNDDLKRINKLFNNNFKNIIKQIQDQKELSIT